MSALILDVATVRAGLDLLRGAPRDDEGRGVDLDITALGTLIEGICFSDSVQVPDIGHGRGAELAEEAGEAVQFIPLATDQQAKLISAARFWLRRHCDPDGLAELFGAAPSVQDVRWGSAGYYLLETLGIRGKETSEVAGALRDDRGSSLWSHEPESAAPSDRPLPGQRYEDRGHYGGKGGEGTRLDHVIADLLDPYKEGDTYLHHWILDPEVESMVKRLAWTLLRARCYLLWADEVGAPYMPHPVRARMAGFAAAVEDKPDEFVHHSERQSFLHRYLDCLHTVHREGVEAVAEIGVAKLLRFPFPAVLPYVIERAGDRGRILEAAYELRATRGAKDLRARIAEFQQQVTAGDLVAAVELRDELDRLTTRLRQDLGLLARPSITTSLSIGPPEFSLQVDGPSIPLPVGAGRAMDRLRRPRLVLLRDIFDAMASASSLGRLHEILYPV
jgi:hypothetical protein